MRGAPGMEEIDAEWKRKARAYPLGYQQPSDSDAESGDTNETSWSEEERIWQAKRGEPAETD